jgi:predicted anti-sigma-YlaC factor YlaD
MHMTLRTAAKTQSLLIYRDHLNSHLKEKCRTCRGMYIVSITSKSTEVTSLKEFQQLLRALLIRIRSQAMRRKSSKLIMGWLLIARKIINGLLELKIIHKILLKKRSQSRHQQSRVVSLLLVQSHRQHPW